MDRVRARRGEGRSIVTIVLAVLGLCTLGCLGCFGGGFGVVMLGIRSTEIYARTLAVVKTDERVTAALGAPVEEGFLVSGKVETDTAIQTAHLIVPFHGPVAEGAAEVQAHKQPGQEWAFDTFELVVKGSGQRIDLREELPEFKAARAAKTQDALQGVGELLAAGKLDEADAVVGLVLAEDPENVVARSWRGRILLARGDKAAAGRELDAVLLDPEAPASALVARGELARGQGDLEECFKRMTEALRKDPELAVAWLGRARCYEAQGDLRSARAGAREACDLGDRDGCTMMNRLDR